MFLQPQTLNLKGLAFATAAMIGYPRAVVIIDFDGLPDDMRQLYGARVYAGKTTGGRIITAITALAKHRISEVPGDPSLAPLFDPGWAIAPAP